MRRENIQFETAVLVSLLLHIAFLGGWAQRDTLARLPVVGVLAQVLTPAPKPALLAKANSEETPVEPVITFVEEPTSPTPSPTAPTPPARPKQFIETDDTQVSGEKPKNADFYSDRSTVAANPVNPTGKSGDTPFLDGTETRMMSTADVAPKLSPTGAPLPPGPPQMPRPATPAMPASPAPAPAPLLKPVDLPSRPTLEAKADTKPMPETKPDPDTKSEPEPKPEPEIKPVPETKPGPDAKSSSEKEHKGVKEGTEPDGAREKPKPVPEEGLTTQPETKLAMLTPPPTPKTVPMPPTPPPAPPPMPDTPPAKPELSLQQPPSPGSAGSPPIPDAGGGGGGGGAAGATGSGSEREIAARKSRLNTVGVTRLGVAAFNVESSPFGAYDKQVVRAVQSRWYALIEKNGLYERAGEVTIHFQLLPDGSVTNATVKSTSAGEILALFCQKAIVESAPFAPWPEELRTYLGNEPRDVDFTFYY